VADDRFTRTVLETIRAHRMVEPGMGVLLALSGGRDSMALLDVMTDLSERLDLRLAAGHIDHGLRPDSSLDAAFVADLCKSRNIPFFLRVLSGEDLRKGEGGLEGAARAARIAGLMEIAGESRADRIATGHHRDDQAETVLYRVLRGAGSPGLSGILPVAGMFIRPLLQVTRKMIDGRVREKGISFREDATNRDAVFIRNALRKKIMPACEEIMPGASASLARLAQAARLEASALDEWAEADMARLVRESDSGFTLDVEGIREMGRARRLVILRALVRRMEGVRVQMANLDGLDKLILSKNPSARAGIGGGWTARREYGSLLFGKEEDPCGAGEGSMAVPGNLIVSGVGEIRATNHPRASALPEPRPRRAILRPPGISGELSYRSVKPGDRYRPVGLGGERKLSDLFTDAKIPARLRSSIPVFHDEEGIVWVPGFAPAERVAHPLDGSEAVVLELFPEKPGSSA